MIDFLVSLVYSFFLLGTIIAGLIFVLRLLAHVLPHTCYDQRADRSFDIAAIFCGHCFVELSFLFLMSRTYRYLRTASAVLAPAYILYLGVKVFYVDALNMWELVGACFLSLVAMFFNEELYLVHPYRQTHLPMVSGSFLYAIFGLYFHLSANFILVSLVLLVFNMFIFGVHRSMPVILGPGWREDYVPPIPRPNDEYDDDDDEEENVAPEPNGHIGNHAW